MMWLICLWWLSLVVNLLRESLFFPLCPSRVSLYDESMLLFCFFGARRCSHAVSLACVCARQLVVVGGGGGELDAWKLHIKQ